MSENKIIILYERNQNDYQFDELNPIRKKSEQE